MTSAPQQAILVVDDDALINMGTVDLVEELGYRAIEAYSGAEALEALAQNPAISAIITDFSMPGMSGLELAERARQLRPGLPVLLASGYSELPAGLESDLPRLSKPFQASELASQLDLIFGNAP